ncbi:STAS domain-containing protein [Kitasatospora sp. NBC_01287]|uniref:STAS domain-containing protein n=1 Tax=Kitasatospora sp. NBC_01287 TaxID=2903573 RepID=UPI002257018E|nr:STAS domain-containing protein [Kitasatospora sp. NBC_01287]MCX4744622.1 STAS domain-containing protein [Kitasatospora sp. NBC_01287]
MAERPRTPSTPQSCPVPVRAAGGGPLLSVGLAVVGTVVRVDLLGDLDLDTGPQLTEAVSRGLIDRPRVVIIDLSGVGFCDCAGLTALLRAGRRIAGTGAAFHLERPSAVVRRLLQLTGTAAALGLPDGARLVGPRGGPARTASPRPTC